MQIGLIFQRDVGNKIFGMLLCNYNHDSGCCYGRYEMYENLNYLEMACLNPC